MAQCKPINIFDHDSGSMFTQCIFNIFNVGIKKLTITLYSTVVEDASLGGAGDVTLGSIIVRHCCRDFSTFTFY